MILLTPISICGSLLFAWWNTSYLAEQVVGRVLDANGFSLQHFSMQRPTNWSIHVERIEMTSENIEMILAGLEIDPLELNEAAVDLKRASITVQPGPEDTSDPLDWRTLIESSSGGIALLPGRGVIRRF